MQIKKPLLILGITWCTSVCLHAQVEQDISFSAGYAGLFQNGDDDLTIQTAPTGFIYALNYGVQFGTMGILISPFFAFHMGKSEADMLSYFAEKGTDVIAFKRSISYDNGILMGMRLALLHAHTDEKPKMYLHFQSGPAACRLNDGSIEFNTGSDHFITRTLEATGLGLATNVGVDANLLGTGYMQFGLSAGVQHVIADIPVESITVQTNNGGSTTNATSVFTWRETDWYLTAHLIIPIGGN